jgi:hypothetical protein
MSSRTARLARPAVLLALVLALSGCVTTAGGTIGELGRSANSSAADTASAQLALTLFGEGRSSVGVSGTALSDALSNLADTQGSVASTSVATREERSLRAQTLTALDRAVTAVEGAQDVVAGTPGAPAPSAARSALASVTAVLKKLGRHS